MSRYFTDAARIFADVVRRHPAMPALVWSASRSTSYEELDRLSNQIARLLIARGVRKRQPICLCLEKELPVYACILACLKAGLPYFVVDPASPMARTAKMLDCCEPAVAFVNTSAMADAFRCPAIVLTEESVGVLLAGMADDSLRLDWTIDGADPAYIMFTSGSTGAPKGVTISQDNLVHFIFWSQNQFATTPDDRFTNVNPLFFDNSVFDIYASLFAGASLVPFTASTMRDPKAVVSRIESLGCTVYFSVPSLLVYLQTMKLLTPTWAPSLRAIVFGGEGYPKPMLVRLWQTLGNRTALYNVYGPTECTCICSAYQIGATDLADTKGLAPLGQLIPTFSYVILDERDQEALPGQVGELCLGGPCVGLGYYNDPEQTARRFVQNPVHNRFTDRVYRTGDLVRYDPVDGNLHYVGRGDSQIKHQGYRIELGEIEHALAAIQDVDEAAAVYVGGRIVGVVASRLALDPRNLKSALADTLPRFMVPDKIVVVPELLKNANGKIDRKAIAAAEERVEV